MGKYPYPTHGWDAVRLYSALTIKQLQEMMQAIYDDPSNANPDHARGDIHLYTKAARKKLDVLSWAITYHLKDRQTA